MNSSGSDLQAQPLTVRIGAELTGVDLRQPLDARAVAWIRSALLRHKVVFLRGQHLDREQQVAFASHLGELTAAHPTVPGAEGAPGVFELDSHAGGRANHWHTDVTFTDRPPAVSVLRAVVVPPVGGDTIWANTATAYEGLPAPLRALADGLRAVHTNRYDYGRANPAGAVDDAARRRRVQFESVVFETEHPVVRVHPETGERSLLLGGFAQHVVGLSSRESADLIRALQDRVTAPEHTVRWRWREGDVAVWDNRAPPPYAVDDYGDAHRVGQRVTVAGPLPGRVGRRPSPALRGGGAGL